MSVSNQTNKVYGSGNGVTATFSYSFKVFDVAELYAYKIAANGTVTGPLTYTTDFTATISSVAEGGTITFIVPPASGTTWFLKRLVPYTQSAVIPTEGNFPGKQFENQLDLITMMVIQANETVTRCAQLAPTSLISGVTMPDPVDGYALAWSGTAGTLINYPINAAAITAAVTATAASATAAAASASTASTQATNAAASAVSAAASAVTAALFAVPSGGIIMWHGTIASIPSGWVLCNGSNGTPDLRNRFIVCADADVGGVAKSTIGGSAAQSGGSTTIDVTQIPAHTHTVASNVSGSSFGSVTLANTNSASDTNRTSSSTGGGLPYTQPYYALAYIMKT